MTGRPISPNNVARQQIFPACKALGLERATWLTFRRTYSSWAHEKGVPGKVVAQLMGHAKVDTTLNVYTQVVDGALRTAVDKIGSGLFTIVHNPEGARLRLLERAPTLEKSGGFSLSPCAAPCRALPALVAAKGQEKGNVPMPVELTLVEGGIPAAPLLGERDHQG